MNIEARLAKLERQNRNLRRTLALIVIGGAVVTGAGMQGQRLSDLRARSLTVVDGQDKPRITLWVDERSDARIMLVDAMANAENHVHLVAGRLDARISAMSLSGKATLHSTVGGPSLAIQAGNTVRYITGFDSKKDTVYSKIFDGTNRELWQAP
ncbi:MAG: hypothetical protein HY000_10815 [Planctomycetes bacterium]|nr:hypothetical protein [Planctomycetota bacterium]